MNVGCGTQADASCPIREACGRGAIRKNCGNVCKSQKPARVCVRPGQSPYKNGTEGQSEGQATRDTSPRFLRVGFTVISMSWPRAVRKSMRRSTEKEPARLRIKAET